jgi:hypothetical protein
VKETKQKKNAYLVLDTSGRELILEPHLVIRDGVKETKYNQSHQEPKFKEVLKNGVRITLESDWDVPTDVIDGVLENGVKETKTPGNGDIVSTVEWMKENNSNSYPKMINDVIENGIKETKLFDDDDWVNTNRIVDEVIDNGVKETKHANKYDSIGPVFKEGKINDIIDNGVKVSGTFVGGKRQKEDVESVIGYGTKNPTD